MKKHQFTKLAIIAMLATVLSVSSACTQTSTPTSEKDSNGTVTSENSSEQIISADTVEYANAYLKAVNSLYYNGIADYFTFVNLDGDDVPDMVAGKAYDGFETPVFLYSFYNGEAKRVMESRVGIEGHTFSFSEGQGLVYATRSWDGVTMEEVYEWKDGELKDYKTFSDIDNEMLDEQGFFIDEKNVTEDEFWKEFNDFTAAHNPYVGIWGDYITKDSRVEPHDSNESIFYEEGSREDCMTYSETVQYLTGLGARRIGFVGDRDHCCSFFERWFGFSTGLRGAGIPLDERICILAPDSSPYHDPDWLIGQISQMPGLPDAFVCANDYLAIHLMTALKKMGISIPKDIMVTGFDGTSQAALVDPPLTTVTFSGSDISRIAANILLYRIGNPDLPFIWARVKTTPEWRKSTMR